MHCKHMGVEIRIDLHSFFHLVALFSRVAFEDEPNTTFVSSLLLPFGFGSVFLEIEKLPEGWNPQQLHLQ